MDHHGGGKTPLQASRSALAYIGTTLAHRESCTGLDGELDPNRSTPKSDTGACVDGACVVLAPEDPARYPKCACAAKGGAARCIPKAKVPTNVAGQLESCTQGGAGVCVPDPLVKSGGKAPPTCKSPFGEGRCMSTCVPEIAKNADLLNRGEGDVCAEDERCGISRGDCTKGFKCAPCTNPLNGKSTGAPGCPGTP